MDAYQDFTLILELENDEQTLSVRALTPSGGEFSDQIKLSLPPPLFKDSWPWDEFESKQIEQYGAQIAGLLFPGSLRDGLRRSLSRLSESSGLRIRLRLSQPALAALPWELAFDPAMGFLALDTRTPILRDWSLPMAPTSLQASSRLRILVAYPAPEDLPKLDLSTEKAQLREALDIPVQRGQIELTFMDEPVTLDKLSDELHAGNYQILQISGHGTQDEKTRKALLFFEDEKHRSQPVDPAQFRALLQGTQLSLVSVIALDSAYFGVDKAFDSLAPAALQAGVPAYLGLQSGIMDTSAIRFARSFYAALADGLPLERALTEAIRTILFNARQTLEWAMPVLYSRLPDTTLFIPERVEKGMRVGQSTVNVGGAVVKGAEYIQSAVDMNVSQTVQYIEAGAKSADTPLADNAGDQPIPSSLRLADIDPMIAELKEAISRESSLTPRDRIKGMSLAEELRWALVSSSPDARHIAELERGVMVIGSGPAQVMSSIRKRLAQK